MVEAEIIDVPVVTATRQSIADYGIFIATDVPESGLAIPFYKGAVEEGHNLPFQYTGKAVVRTARIHPRSGDIIWLERHLRMSQIFIGLGDAPLGLVLGKPTPQAQVPNLTDVVAFVLPPGHGVMIHPGTWHDFPMAIDRPVTVLTANSSEVIEALISQKSIDEMDRGDVFKIDVKKRTGKTLKVRL